ncbi:nucleotidyltransferase domain-containing protein [Bacillus sp. Marseille-Q3570]|uniref:nucleotidyltransferase domain-containing protein n=1 Tax=Bacillus sp. Marseille-Q3570 TaxID=2963522 RepID=UPI0021B7FA53|nr:nucleotidyltransferase domain-containing protein [Bacillus sp. Marseille-Q3570]
MCERKEPLESAVQFINMYFQGCDAALLAGSTVRGDATVTSDLDIVIFDRSVPSSYRESFLLLGWPIEVFVHNLSSYKHFFKSDYERARPSMQRMIFEGIILKGKEIIDPIKKEAKGMLEEGPEEWSSETIRLKRYFITDTLDDFIGSSNRSEQIFIANTLSEMVSEFVLRTNRKWIGSSKWIVRALNQYDLTFTAQFIEAFDSFYKHDDKKMVIKLVDEVLQPFGGKLFDGFSMGKRRND